jgi:hypothetical protein
LNSTALAAPRRHIGIILAAVYALLAALRGRLVEVTVAHLRHPNNGVPHFGPDVVGSWDSFPVFSNSTPHRFQPKYEDTCVKFSVICSHAGFFCFISGPHPGAMNDGTLSRQNRPALLASDTVLGDKAYIAVPNCLPHVKGKDENLTPDEREFNRVLQFYRARVEHRFAWLKHWEVLGSFRGHDLAPLEQAVHLIASLHNIFISVNLPYPPYRRA